MFPFFNKQLRIYASCLIMFVDLLMGTAGNAQRVVINELMTSNASSIQDEDGDTPDWIELYNASTTPVDLVNWAITDDSLEIDKWLFPATVIQPGEYLLIFASNKDRKDGKYLHTSFRLGAGRESVFLYNQLGQRMDEYTSTCIPSGFSYGHTPDGTNPKTHLITPTPGSSNNESATASINPGKDTLVFSHSGGFFTQAFNLQLSAGLPGTKIYYTLDGSVPDENAQLYTAPIQVKSRKGDKNDVSEEETVATWEPPQGEVFKATLIRAVAYIDACPAGPVITHTYFVDEKMHQRYTFPILSIATDRSDFFGKKKGIYVSGENDGLGENFFASGKEWERSIHVEFFNETGMRAFGQGMGARIHGRGSRQNPQKSVRIYAREEYGSEWLNFQMFPDLAIDKFKTLILRTPDADFSQTIFKDELIQTLIRPMNLDLQATRPSVVFINGEYWGIHNIRERYDKHYFAQHNGVDSENVDFLGLTPDGNEIIEGDSQHYTNIIQYIRSHNLAEDVHYQYIASQVDIANFVDYHIAHLFFANWDWPNNNMRFWRPRTPEGKWRWVFFDCDACMIQDSYKFLYLYSSSEKNDPKYKTYEESTFLLRNLLQNQQFRTLFLQKFMHHLNTTFEPGRIINEIQSFKQTYAPEALEHIYRWNSPDTYTTWMQNLEEIKLFALRRPVEMLNQLETLYQLPILLYPNPSTGEFQVDLGDDEQTPLNIQVYTTKGQLIQTHAYVNSKAAKGVPIKLNHQPAGLYIVRIQYGNLVFNKKLVLYNQ
jgi:hypothetical protein